MTHLQARIHPGSWATEGTPWCGEDITEADPVVEREEFVKSADPCPLCISRGGLK